MIPRKALPPTLDAQVNLAIKADRLSKCYQIYDRPHDRLKQSVLPRLQRCLGRDSRQYFREFWALRDVSFEVRLGETIGIVGQNGSGKSTLLQLICGTLTPSSGTVRTQGKIAALLELGSGFNPEFTGRENVYLNASLLGLTKEQTDERFGSIERFADIGEFIDQPVRTYSSGMVVRLAFSVIAHVDADILVVDEALAVGDAIFTQKCMRFIRAFQERGTLFFVSHDMGAVASLCSRAIWLDRGQLKLDGSAKEVTQAYLAHTLQAVYGESVEVQTLVDRSPRSAQLDNTMCDELETPAIDYEAKTRFTENISGASGFSTGSAEILSVTLNNVDNPSALVIGGGERVTLVVKARAHANIERPIIGFTLNDRLGQVLFGENTLSFTDLQPTAVFAGSCFSGKFVFYMPMLPNGDYVVFASVADGELTDNTQHHLLHNALVIKVYSSKVRYGLVGIHFYDVEMITDAQDSR